GGGGVGGGRGGWDGGGGFGAGRARGGGGGEEAAAPAGPIVVAGRIEPRLHLAGREARIAHQDVHGAVAVGVHRRDGIAGLPEEGRGERERGGIAEAAVAQAQLHLAGAPRDQVGDAVAVEVGGRLAGQGHAGGGDQAGDREGAVADVEPIADRVRAGETGEVDVAVAVEVRGNGGSHGDCVRRPGLQAGPRLAVEHLPAGGEVRDAVA